ncbi:lipopolysaccharide kinase InaA family protein [Pseudomonas fulva]|uniref:Lipopolysaccharide kinase n=1 Tax=Pseudomonas fulva (strain 12-X) TaxID=743720 RepID=F6AKR4_PSEF1|nr:lipopolysaccharide kinase InaA family protein [Pseudomonas fulva]AEF24138.1 lipopolysaccharide kinase [Pseudomonas fulva 12-X]
MKEFIAEQDRILLERNGLASFDALWALKLEAVDEPNTERGGWSSVYRLDVEGHGFYLKRQSNYLTRSPLHPLGEPTFSREFRNIQRYRKLGIPALQAALFAEQRVAGERRAVLLTRALDGWQDLDHWLGRWSVLDDAPRLAILKACGALARCVHDAGQVHGCFYPKHIFLREEQGAFQAQLIDLEKTRPLLFGRRDRIKDLEPLVRRARAWGKAEIQVLLESYLGGRDGVAAWWSYLDARRRDKEGR